MATIQEIIQLPEYHVIDLVAGHEGVYRKITGINIMESIDSTMFCRPDELIVTTGIQMRNDEDQLEKLVRDSFSKSVAGLIINTGPYITRIPESTIQFANEHDFPIFQMDWKYRIADLLKTTFQFLSTHQEQQSSVEKLLTNLLFRYKHFQDSIQEAIQQLGFPTGAELGIITCTTTSSNKHINRYEGMITAAFQNRYRYFLSLKYKNQLIYPY